VVGSERFVLLLCAGRGLQGQVSPALLCRIEWFGVRGPGIGLRSRV